MTFTRGLFIHPDATRGTTALEARQSLAGLIPGPGVLDGLMVSGTASWQYSVSAGHVATSRGIDTDGVVIFANDAPVLVDCSPAPGTGSRIDIVYAKHNDATTPNADPNSDAVVAVEEGIASGTPVAPEIPDGAIELGRATVSAGATNTDHANVTISHGERLITTTLGGIMTTHSFEQRAAAYFNTTARPVFAWRTDTQTLDVAWGEGWKQIYPPVIPATADTGWATASVPTAGWSGEHFWRVRDGVMWYGAAGTRTGSDVVAGDFWIQTMIEPSWKPAKTMFGTCWVGSNSYRTYIATNGEIHVEPFWINSGQTFRIELNYPCGS